MNMTVNVPRRVIRSDNQAQNTRPTPLPRLAIPTIPPATIALALVSSSKMGASWEMMAMPADVLRKRISQSAHHCQALRASESTKSCVARCAVSFSLDRKSTRLNSSHSQISYAVFCLKKKINIQDRDILYAQ